MEFMRILWSANAIWCASGYGIQGRYLLPRLQALGNEIGMHAWYGLEGGCLNLNNMPVYPKANDPYGNDIIEAHAHHFKADIVVSLMDVWVLHEYGKKKMRWIPYMPIDHDPVPPRVLKALEGAYRVVSYARFGEKLLNAAGVKNTYIPHGVDVDVYKPIDKSAARKKMGLDDDAFVIGMVAANKGFPSRKAFPENLAAVRIFKERHPKQKIRVYLHTLEGTQHGGIDFSALLESLGFARDEILFCNQYQYILGYPDTYLANAYNAMDVLLASTMSEGFGIPIIEAQACGTPVITTNFSAMPELTFGGYICEAHQKFWTALNSWIVMPSIEDIAAGLEWAYMHRRDQGLRMKAQRGAADYAWDTIVKDYWTPFLDDVAQSIANEPSQPNAN